MQELVLTFLGPDLRRAFKLSQPTGSWPNLTVLQMTTVSYYSTQGLTSNQSGISDLNDGSMRLN